MAFLREVANVHEEEELQIDLPKHFIYTELLPEVLEHFKIQATSAAKNSEPEGTFEGSDTIEYIKPEHLVQVLCQAKAYGMDEAEARLISLIGQEAASADRPLFENFSFLDFVAQVSKHLDSLYSPSVSSDPVASENKYGHCSQKIIEFTYIRYMGPEPSVDPEWGRNFQKCDSKECKQCLDFVKFVEAVGYYGDSTMIYPLDVEQKIHLGARLSEAKIDFNSSKWYDGSWRISIEKPSVDHRRAHPAWVKRLEEVRRKLKAIDDAGPNLRTLLGKKYDVLMNMEEMKKLIAPKYGGKSQA